VDERKEKELARGPFIKWEQVIRDLVTVIGIDKPTATRREHLAEAVGVKVHALDSLLRQLREIGALETIAVSGGYESRGPSGRKFPIRNQQYTIKKSAEDILFLGKKRGIKWGQHVSLDKQPELKIERVPAERMDEPTAPPMPTPTPKPTPVPPSPEPEIPDSPFAVLRPLKRDEQRALVEAAIQYKENRAFIDEEVQRFAERGLHLDPAVIGFPVDDRLEHIALVGDYVSRLMRENERLQDYANQKGRDESEVKELRLTIARQEQQIADIARARRTEHEEAARLSGQHSGKVATLTQRIQTLEQQNRDLTNKLHPPKAGNGTAVAAVK
jgi:hypothetical protein